MKTKILFAMVLTAALGVSGAHASDCWLSVNGTGAKTGRDAQNAMAAVGSRGQSAQLCWDRTGPGDTMHVLPGEYAVKNDAAWSLHIKPGNDGSGSLGGFKKLIGVGKVLVSGDRPVPYKFETKDMGVTWLLIDGGVQDVLVKGFSVQRVAYGVMARGGRHNRLRFEELNFEDTRQNIVIKGAGKGDDSAECGDRADGWSSNIRIRAVNGLRYSKRHVRLQDGVQGVLVEDSNADAAFLDGDFAVGFDAQGPACRVLFRNCTARRNRYSGSDYWNGDGFKAEEKTSFIQWVGCSAFDNADAGFDIKTPGARMLDIIALRNTRNVRIWSRKPAVLHNVNASYAVKQGGNAAPAGFWTQGRMECHHCTAHNNPVAAMIENNGDSGEIHFYDSILSLDKGMTGEILSKEGGTKISLFDTAVWDKGVQGADPRFDTATGPEWEGGTPGFTSDAFGRTKGYRTP